MARTGRPRAAIRTIPVCIQVPEDLVARVELQLYSELEGRVPLGEKSRFYIAAAEHYLKYLNSPQVGK